MNVYFDEDDYTAQCDNWEEIEKINAKATEEDESQSYAVFVSECRADWKGVDVDRGSYVDGLLEWESDGEFDDDDDDLIFD